MLSKIEIPRSFVTLAVAVLLVGCSQGTQVTRLDPETTIDLSGFWNDTD